MNETQNLTTGTTYNFSLRYEITDSQGDSVLGVIGDLYKIETDGYWLDTQRDGSLTWVPADAVTNIEVI